MKKLHVRMMAASVIAACSADAWAARVDYTIDAGIEQNSNVALSPNDPIEQRYSRAGLGFIVTDNLSALQVNVNGRVEYRGYRDDVFDDTVDGVLSGRLNWVAIPDRLSFSLEDSLTVQPVNTLAPNAPGNRQQVNVLSLGPTLLFDWTRALRGRAELRYIDSNAEVSDEFNSNQLTLAVGAIRELTPTSSLSLLTQAQAVDFDNDVVARDYHRYDLYARYERKLARFELEFDAGYSRIDYRRGKGRTDPLLRANLKWNPSAQSAFTASASSQFSDTAGDALSSISMEPPSAVPDNVLTGRAVINASPYVVRGAELGYAYSATRVRWGASVYAQKRNYIDTDTFDQKLRGARADFAWVLRPALTFDVYATREKVEYTSLLREDKTSRTGAMLRYQMARRWSAGFSWEHYKRDSSDPGQTVSQNIAYLSLSYSNR